MEPDFENKGDAREYVWNLLDERGAARFPFPIEGRIPNFEDAPSAAERLLEHEIFEGVTNVKINPDSPQRPLREMALRRGINLYVPTPRLRGGFMEFDPSRIPPEAFDEAASLSKWDQWKRPIELEDLPEFDLVVSGSVAVTPGGCRCGKGEGYSDLEYGILLELGHPAVPVATTVHELQIVDSFPVADHDVSIDVIATPERTLAPRPSNDHLKGIHWSELTDEELEEMPVLARLEGSISD